MTRAEIEPRSTGPQLTEQANFEFLAFANYIYIYIIRVLVVTKSLCGYVSNIR